MPTKDEMFKFQEQIENMVINSDYNYMEAIVDYCDRTGMEIELASEPNNSFNSSCLFCVFNCVFV